MSEGGVHRCKICNPWVVWGALAFLKGVIVTDLPPRRRIYVAHDMPRHRAHQELLTSSSGVARFRSRGAADDIAGRRPKTTGPPRGGQLVLASINPGIDVQIVAIID